MEIIILQLTKFLKIVDISAVYVIDDAVVGSYCQCKNALASTTSYGGGNDTLDIMV